MADGRFELRQDIFPIGADLFGMEAEHGIAIVRILTTEVKDGLTRLEVDARHQHLRDTSLSRTGHHFVEVGGELLTIQMTMCIDKGEHHD